MGVQQTYCILSSNLQSLLQQSETRPAVRISHEYLPSVFILNSQMTGGYDINTSDFESEKRIIKLRMGLSKIATQKSKLVGGFSPPLWKIWESSSVGMMTFPTKKNNSKPPTSDYWAWLTIINHHYPIQKPCSKPPSSKGLWSFSQLKWSSLVGQWVNPVMGDPTIPSVVVDKAVFWETCFNHIFSSIFI